MIVSWLLSAQTLSGVAIAFGLWIFAKVFDFLLQRYLGKRVVAPAVNAVTWRVKSLLTRFDPIEASFHLNYTPRESLTVSEAKDAVEDVLSEISTKSGGRVITTLSGWNDRQGRYSATHSDAKEDYEIKINLNRDVADLTTNPDADPSDRMISEIHFEITFSFPFPHIDTELANIGVLVAKLEQSLDEEIGGTGSPARILLHSVENSLTLDSWILDEDFEVGLRLTGKNDDVEQTEIEFFSDHIEVYPPYYEIDGELIRYIRILVMNYYLLGTDLSTGDRESISHNN